MKQKLFLYKKLQARRINGMLTARWLINAIQVKSSSLINANDTKLKFKLSAEISSTYQLSGLFVHNNYTAVGSFSKKDR